MNTVPKLGRPTWRMCMAADAVIKWWWQTEVLLPFLYLYLQWSIIFLDPSGALKVSYEISHCVDWIRSQWTVSKRSKIKSSLSCDECCKSYRLVLEAGRRCGRFERHYPFPEDCRLIKTSLDFICLSLFEEPVDVQRIFPKEVNLLIRAYLSDLLMKPLARLFLHRLKFTRIS
jgi:hypothetical protein